MPNSIIRKNNINVTDRGAFEQTIVFAHGFGTDQTAWHEVVESFADRYRIILYDNVGGGKSDPAAFSPNRYNTLDSYADDLRAICEHFELKDAIMVGHSVSGMIALLTAVQHPQFFSKLVLVGASPRYLDDEGYVGGFDQESLDGLYGAMENNYFAWASGFSAYAMANPDNPALAESFAATLRVIRPDIALSVARVIFQSDYRNELPRLNLNTLLIQTRADIAVPLDVAQYLNRNIAGSTLTVIDAEGHFPHISAPQEVINAITNFI